jgi:glycosyltransferase involved in cell wall biosynthesis
MIEKGWLSVVIPAYNEKLRIPSTLREIELFHKKYPDVISKLIIVDDGSSDNTMEVSLLGSANIPAHVCRLPENKGKWAAIHEGFKLVETDAILILDADGSAQISELKRIHPDHLEWIRENKVSVFGTRFGSEVVEGKSFLRTIVSRVYRLYVLAMYKYATGRVDVSDMQCPFKLVWKSKMMESFDENRFCGDIELACCIQGKIENRSVRFVHMTGSKVKTETIWEMSKGTWRVARRFRNLYFRKDKNENIRK